MAGGREDWSPSSGKALKTILVICGMLRGNVPGVWLGIVVTSSQFRSKSHKILGSDGLRGLLKTSSFYYPRGFHHIIQLEFLGST